MVLNLTKGQVIVLNAALLDNQKEFHKDLNDGIKKSKKKCDKCVFGSMIDEYDKITNKVNELYERGK